MGYIIAGANLANVEKPSVVDQVETATEALEKVQRLERDDYHVRTSTAEGEDLSVATLAARIVLDEA
ncbi:hypothetical protein [Methylobacterium longum]|uniref:Uncharacterized protein n=1 Tax=Methylobacterium longum TaxID=767694 RepID=A0ABT8ANW7_9HYPH|nr:hypothetical protein [Methylobacterium longum]MDN3571584.1 hypothetical protein [Methylobacterium longum]